MRKRIRLTMKGKRKGKRLIMDRNADKESLKMIRIAGEENLRLITTSIERKKRRGMRQTRNRSADESRYSVRLIMNKILDKERCIAYS